MSYRSYGFPNTKAAGEWVESVFIVKAGALGLAVSKPFGDSQPYDFLVSRRNLAPVRVQIKSAFAKLKDFYFASVHSDRRDYRPADVDFLVVYIPPEDAWYVLPAADIHVRMLPLRPHRLKGLYEKYRDAWGLLTGDPEDDTRSLGFTIHAQAE